MFDIKAIRENPEEFDRLWAKRGLEPQTKKIIDQDKLIRKAMQVVQEAEAARNKSSKLIGAAMAKGDKEEAERLKTEVAGAKNVIAAMGAQVESEKAMLHDLLSSLPNIPFAETPEGESEDDNVELTKWSEPRVFDFEPKSHEDIGVALGLMDFETAAKMSGSRFVILRGALSRMDRALAALMLDMQTAEGFEETSPPFLVWPKALYGTSQLPKFAEDLYPAGEDHYLIPTAEVSLTNTVRESILDADTLPRRMTAHTPCFRSEAGSAGRDTTGMIRQHQFNKVELVTICKPDDSEAEHKNMLRCAELVLQKLDLPYRVVELCTGDLGFGARKTYDIEVWLPSQNTYREISSISNCGDFQARRMNARYKFAEKDNRFVHTLNGSGLAVGRTLVAVLENYQNEDGTVTVPDALVPYMGGLEIVG
ncbi:serine--tRNA ligase [Litorimonas sp. WD9-15]|uniref:serine--tRNA ligase n=1 Tax=Litorimonas sp. WD9-15 TaxID=3418716 RepID=UPI003D02E0BA